MDFADTAESITADSIVQGVIDRYPQAIVVFAHHGLQCVGCYIAPFHTIADCAREHRVTVEPLLGELNQAVCETGAIREENTW
jgi:hybrid cluster-associated redox disulfide protein